MLDKNIFLWYNKVTGHVRGRELSGCPDAPSKNLPFANLYYYNYKGVLYRTLYP
jgi:hypothetical protein